MQIPSKQDHPSVLSSRPRISLAFRIALLSLVGVFLGLILASGKIWNVQAAGPFTVDTTSDTPDASPGNGSCADGSGFCSLRAAIQEANASGGLTTIIVPAGVYNLVLGELKAGDTPGTTITITGTGTPANTILQPIQPGTCPAVPASCVRVFNLDFMLHGNIAVSISNITIKNGSGNSGGGGILAGGTGDVLNLDNVVFDSNTTSALNGGAISFTGAGTLNVQNSIFLNNSSPTGNGGAIHFLVTKTGGLTVTNSTFSGNSAAGGTIGGQAGAINAGCGLCTPFSVTHNTFTNNTAAQNGASGGQGGAMFLGSGSITGQYNQIYPNSALGGGSGVLHSGVGTADASKNWWGCNGGPGAIGCDSVQNLYGTLLTTPFLRHYIFPIIHR